MELKITSFPAENGESNLIECFGNKKTNILIDFGYTQTYERFIKKKLQTLSNKNEKIDLLIITHYDKDHIEGAIAFFEDLLSEYYIDIEEIWINDFLALSSIDVTEKLNNSQEIIYDYSRFIMKSYRWDSSKIIKSEISKKDSITITRLIKSLGLDKKVNKNFINKVACVQNNSIQINGEVEINLFGPPKSNLEDLLIEFINWFEQKTKFFNYLDKEELFEMFVANMDENVVKGVNQVLNRSPISHNINYDRKISNILNSKQTFRDKSLSNKSSIALSLKFKDIKLLFPGDIDAESVVEDNLYQGYDLVKVSHHGSRNNINQGILQILNCQNYLICTSGKGSSKHPDLETLVYIAKQKKSNIYINYMLNAVKIPRKVIKILNDIYGLQIYEVDGTKNKVLELIFHKGDIKCNAIDY